MAYATLADLVTRYGADEIEQLTDRAGRAEIDSDPVDAALTDAGALIDGYLAQRYALPVSPAPPLLLRLACDVARFNLHGNAATEAVRAAYKDALTTLRDLSTGTAVLPGAAAATSASNPAAGGGSVAYSAPTRVFGPGGTIGDFFG